jgi:NADH-quinone oxidoreductase subunit H
MLYIFINILLVIVPLLLTVAYMTLFERKVLAVIQRRQGPNVVGPFGLLQPLSDGFKLLMKETILPSNSNRLLFLAGPVISFFISMLGWAVIPFSKFAAYSDLGLAVLYILSTSALGLYGILISGWASNSKFAFLGALRSTAQMMAYELPLTFTILTVVACAGTTNLDEICYAQDGCWYFIPLFIPCGIFFIAALAETNRHPFDLPEAESELVSGYNVEYSGMTFALFSLAEYSNILLMCTAFSIYFFGGWAMPFNFSIAQYIPSSFILGFKVAFFFTVFIQIRAALPRYRYDQLMHLGWKVLLPLSIGYFIFTLGILYSFDIYPR